MIDKFRETTKVKIKILYVYTHTHTHTVYVCLLTSSNFYNMTVS